VVPAEPELAAWAPAALIAVVLMAVAPLPALLPAFVMLPDVEVALGAADAPFPAEGIEVVVAPVIAVGSEGPPVPLMSELPPEQPVTVRTIENAPSFVTVDMRSV
jgi:hypothetical protein